MVDPGLHFDEAYFGEYNWQWETTVRTRTNSVSYNEIPFKITRPIWDTFSDITGSRIVTVIYVKVKAFSPRECYLGVILESPANVINEEIHEFPALGMVHFSFIPRRQISREGHISV